MNFLKIKLFEALFLLKENIILEKKFYFFIFTVFGLALIFSLWGFVKVRNE